MKQVILIYLVCMNLLTFLAYGWDKRKAVRQLYRIPESRLQTLTLVGGGLGAFLGGQIFRHKTRKWYFRLCWYLGIMIDLAILYWIWRT